MDRAKAEHVASNTNRRLNRISFTIDDFSIQYENVGKLSAYDLRRTSWLTETWLYDYYKQLNDTMMQDFFIIVSQDGQNDTDHGVNIITFDAYVSFAASAITYDPMEIVSAPFLNTEANARYARSLKLDMESFRMVNLLLDPPAFSFVPSTRASVTTTSRPIGESTTSGSGEGMSMWGKALGGTAIGIIAMLHIGLFGLLLVRSLRNWRSVPRAHEYEEYCSAHDDEEEEEEESLSIHATPSKSPTTYDASGAVFLGTIDEDTSFREPTGVTSEEENCETNQSIVS